MPDWEQVEVVAKGRVRDAAVKMSENIHADWDDEEWLDHLIRAMPRAFELGVLPDYWFELRMTA